MKALNLLHVIERESKSKLGFSVGRGGAGRARGGSNRHVPYLKVISMWSLG